MNETAERNEKLRDAYMAMREQTTDARERQAPRLRAEALKGVVRLDRRPRMFSRRHIME